jgi:hypothetical protein
MATMNLKINISAYTVLGLIFFCLPEVSYGLLSGKSLTSKINNTENLLVSTVGVFFLLNAIYSYQVLNKKCLVTRTKYYTANTTLFMLILLVQVILLWTNSNAGSNDTLVSLVLIALLANNYIGLKRTQRKMFNV